MSKKLIRRAIAAAAALAITAGVPGAAQGKRPDFSGSWTLDADASKALTEKNGQPWRVAGANTGGGTSPPNAIVRRPTTIITQSDRALVIERQYDGEVLDRNVYKLDGSMSVNASRNSSSRSTTVWKGGALVTSGTTRIDFSDGSARDAAGNPIPEIVRDVVTTRTLAPDGTMHVESRTTEKGAERVSYSVYVRVKKAP